MQKRLFCIRKWIIFKNRKNKRTDLLYIGSFFLISCEE